MYVPLFLWTPASIPAPGCFTDPSLRQPPTREVKRTVHAGTVLFVEQVAVSGLMHYFSYGCPSAAGGMARPTTPVRTIIVTM